MRQRRNAAYAAVVALMVTGAVAAAWVLTDGAPDALPQLEPEAAPVFVPVQPATIDFSADATLTAVLAEGAEIPATELVGLVTAVGVTEGTPLHEGDLLYAVAGVPVVVYSGETVLYRPLALGSRGPDVAVAQRLLAKLVPEQAVSTDGVFGPGTAAAVRAYERTWGATPTGVLLPDWFAFLPSDPFDVATVEIRLGEPAPTGGEPIAQGAAQLSQVELSSASSGPPGPYEFVVQGSAVAVNLASDGTWTFPDVSAATALVLAQRSDTSNEVRLSGRTRLSAGVPGQAVPGAAVITDAAGATCVALADAAGTGVGELARVVILGSTTVGLAQLETTLDEDARVLVNPVPFLGDTQCPSS